MTELIWDGKYDKDGRKVAPVRLALPFQTIETVNESAQERQKSLDLFSSGQDGEWRNRLIWGDKKYVLPSLLPEFAGQVNLVYIDPPFDTGADFSFTTKIPDTDESFTKEPSILEQKAYRDTWGRGLDSYLQWFYETVVLLRELLTEDGSLYVHLDWRVGFHAKCVLDEVLGEANFRNDLVWAYGGSGRGAKAIAGQFPRNHDLLLFYSASPATRYNPQRAERRVHPSEASRQGYRQDEAGKWFKTAPRGDYTDASIAALESEGRVHRTRTGSVRIKYFLRTDANYVIEDVLLGDTWTDIPDAMHLSDAEKTEYATQKPEALLDRIIRASSNEGDLVLDCFSGSGTTAAVAERRGRRWITCDLGRFAIHTTRKRLLGIEGVKPFVVQNLGKYERQAWQAAEFDAPEDLQAREAAYRRFILDLYHATPISGRTWLHGVKAGRFVHVGSVDAPVTLADVRSLAQEVWRAGSSTEADPDSAAPPMAAVDVLGWDFAFELNELAAQMAAEAKVDVKFKRIPREVLEKKAVEQGDIRFFELAALSVQWHVRKRAVTLELTDFIIPPDDVPEEVRKSITHWEQWLDYWAVDWDFRGDTFHNQWQSYRTRNDPALQKRIAYTYDEPGEYTIVVKAIDILGNDTTKSLKVQVK